MGLDEFLSLGVQLIPVLWVVLAVETKWLSWKANERGTNRRISNTALLIAYGFPIAGGAMLLGLLAILLGSNTFKWIVVIYMGPALAVSIFTAVRSLLHTIYSYAPIHDPGDEIVPNTLPPVTMRIVTAVVESNDPKRLAQLVLDQARLKLGHDRAEILSFDIIQHRRIFRRPVWTGIALVRGK